MALPRLIFVTGKGGTGKSTIAAALALAFAQRGRCLLASLDGRASAAQMLDFGQGGESVARRTYKVPEPLTLDRSTELEAFIGRIVPMRAIANRMLRSRTFGYVTAAVPGLEAFLLMERMRTIAGDAALNNYHVVADAPASGNALEMLSVAGGVRGLAPLGVLNRIANGVEALLTDSRRFGVLVTATPDELSVLEALDIARRLDELHIAPIAMLLNCAVDSMFEASELEALRKLDGHHQLAVRRRELARRTDTARRRLKSAGVDLIELPMLFCAELHGRELSSLARRLGDTLLANEAAA